MPIVVSSLPYNVLLTKCYFDNDKVCIGYSDSIPAYSGEYTFAEYYKLPEALNPIGLSFDRIVFENYLIKLALEGKIRNNQE